MPDQLTQEWRSGVSEELKSLKIDIKEIKESLVDLKMSTNSLAEARELEKRVRELEDFKLRMVTITAIVQAGILIFWTLLSKLIFK